MSRARTITHYIKVASQGRALDGECLVELEDAINGLVEEAVAQALARVRDAFVSAREGTR